MGMLNRILVEFDYLSGTAVHLVRILCIHTFRVLFAITMFWALKVKKENDIQTYKEIVAFTEGKKTWD